MTINYGVFVNNLPEAVAFFESVLNCKNTDEEYYEDTGFTFLQYGDDLFELVEKCELPKILDEYGNYIPYAFIGFSARSQKEVDDFYKKALDHNAKDLVEPTWQLETYIDDNGTTKPTSGNNSYFCTVSTPFGLNVALSFHTNIS